MHKNKPGRWFKPYGFVLQCYFVVIAAVVPFAVVISVVMGGTVTVVASFVVIIGLTVVVITVVTFVVAVVVALLPAVLQPAANVSTAAMQTNDTSNFLIVYFSSYYA